MLSSLLISSLPENVADSAKTKQEKKWAEMAGAIDQSAEVLVHIMYNYNDHAEMDSKSTVGRSCASIRIGPSH